MPLDQLPTGTRVEFIGFDVWKGYASAMGYHADSVPAQRPGYFRMRRDIGMVANVPCPKDFTYEVVS
jgi:hypothetical protein